MRSNVLSFALGSEKKIRRISPVNESSVRRYIVAVLQVHGWSKNFSNGASSVTDPPESVWHTRIYWSSEWVAVENIRAAVNGAVMFQHTI